MVWWTDGRDRKLRRAAMMSAGRNGNPSGGRPALGAMRRMTDQVSFKWKAKGASMTRDPRHRPRRSHESPGVVSREASAVPQCQAVRARKNRVEGRG